MFNKNYNNNNYNTTNNKENTKCIIKSILHAQINKVIKQNTVYTKLELYCIKNKKKN